MEGWGLTLGKVLFCFTGHIAGTQVTAGVGTDDPGLGQVLWSQGTCHAKRVSHVWAPPHAALPRALQSVKAVPGLPETLLFYRLCCLQIQLRCCLLPLACRCFLAMLTPCILLVDTLSLWHSEAFVHSGMWAPLQTWACNETPPHHSCPLFKQEGPKAFASTDPQDEQSRGQLVGVRGPTV